MAGGNQYSEKWTLKEAKKFMQKAVDLSNDNDYDFIGEVAKDLDSYIDVFDYIIEKFPELKPFKKRIKRNCEVNCFSNAKKSKIVPSLAIMNLKSNHGWTDRVDNTSGDKPLKGDKTTVIFKKK